MTAHAVYAPSSAHRWMLCTASATAIAALPEQEEGEEAAEGTAAHDEIERCLGRLNGREYPPTKIDFASLALPVNPTHPAAHGVGLVLDFVRQLARGGTIWVEQRVELTKDIWGRCDVAHWDPLGAVLTIVDYKNGYVDVQAENNEQLQIYAAASIFTHNLPAKWIRLVVVQPNSFMPVPRVKQWVTSAADLYAFAQRAAAIPASSLTFTAGEQCKYCPLFGRCPASQDVLAQIGTALANAPDQVPADKVALFIAMKKPIEDWFKGVDKVWTKSALTGAVPPGMKLVQTTKWREWIDPAAARAVVIAAKGIEVLQLPTPAQAEKLGVDVSTLAKAPEGGPALAFASDPRAEFKRKSAAEMFKAAVEDERRKDAAA